MPKPKLYDQDDITRYIHIMVDEIKEEFKTSFEAVDFIKQQVAKIPKMESDLFDIKNDMVAVKALLRTHNSEIKDLQAVAHSH